MLYMRHPRVWAAALSLLLAACSGGKSEPQRRGGAETATPEAGYVELHSEVVPLRLELPGRTAAYETSEVRPQVSGIMQSRTVQRRRAGQGGRRALSHRRAAVRVGA